MEQFDGETVLDGLEQFLDLPALMIEPGQVTGRVAVSVEQGGAEEVGRVANRIADQTQGQSAGAVTDLDFGLGLMAVGKRLDLRIDIGAQAEYRMQAAFDMAPQQGGGEVATVIEHPVAGRPGLQMARGYPAFVGMRYQVKVDRNLRVQPVSATEQALRVMGPG